MALTKISTDGVKDDAITKAKIPADQIEASELANNAVDTNAIADQAVTLDKLPHGDANNNGKFLRANNGADPSFEDVPAGGISDVVSDTSPQLGGDLQSNGNDILIAANDRAVFGTDKLRVKHTDSNADIENTTGNIVIKNDSSSTTEQIILQAKGGEDSIKAVADGTVELFHDGTKQCETSANGLAFPSGKGIDFSATANAALFAPASPTQSGQGYDPSTDSEVLTHYEHGTWTPRLRAYDHTGGAGWGHMVHSDGTVVEGTGRYIRIGRLVWAGFNIDTGSKQFDTGWTYWSIDTIPFGANNYDGRSGGVQVFRTNAFTDTTNIIGGRVHGADAYLTGTRPNGEYNATINTSNTGRHIQGHAIYYTSTG